MEDKIRDMAIDFADELNSSSISPRSALIYFAERLSRRFYLVDKSDAERIYNSYNGEQGWSEDSDFVSALGTLIPELTEE